MSLCNFKKGCYICGDFNINLLDINSKQHVNEYFELICSKGFSPRITLPTRIQPPAISLIDNILTNNIYETANSMSGLLINDLSDHKMICTWHKNNTYIEKVNKFVEIEKRDDASMSNFAKELISLNIYDKLDTNIANDPNQNYEKFAEAINYAREKHLPKKKLNIRNPFIKNLNG